MTENFYTGNHNITHTTFGGLIFLSDFETDYRGHDNNHGSPIAQRIESDRRFDEQCRKNEEFRNKGGSAQWQRTGQPT